MDAVVVRLVVVPAGTGGVTLRVAALGVLPRGGAVVVRFRTATAPMSATGRVVGCWVLCCGLLVCALSGCVLVGCPVMSAGAGRAGVSGWATSGAAGRSEPALLVYLLVGAGFSRGA